jgi:hypothetical protein
VEELVDKFTEISIAQGEALIWQEIARFNRLYGEMDRVGSELKQRDGDARHALLRLYSHPNLQVRLNAANRTLAVAPEAAKEQLRAIKATRRQPQAIDAGMTLWTLEEGIFRPT